MPWDLDDLEDDEEFALISAEEVSRLEALQLCVHESHQHDMDQEVDDEGEDRHEEEVVDDEGEDRHEDRAVRTQNVDERRFILSFSHVLESLLMANSQQETFCVDTVVEYGGDQLEDNQEIYCFAELQHAKQLHSLETGGFPCNGTTDAMRTVMDKVERSVVTGQPWIGAAMLLLCSDLHINSVRHVVRIWSLVHFNSWISRNRISIALIGISGCLRIVDLIEPYLDPELVEDRYSIMIAEARCIDAGLELLPWHDLIIHRGLNVHQMLRGYGILDCIDNVKRAECLIHDLFGLMKARSHLGAFGPRDWLAKVGFVSPACSSACSDWSSQSDDGTVVDSEQEENERKWRQYQRDLELQEAGRRGNYWKRKPWND